MKLSTYQKHSLRIVGSIVIILAIGLIDVYATEFNDPVSRALKQFFPAKIVGWHMVSVYDLQIATLEAKNLDASVTREQVAKKLVESEISRNMARALDIKLKSDDETDELAYIIQGEEQDYRKLLDEKFYGRELDFVKYVVYPQAWKALLQTYYNGNTGLHKQQFDLANELLSKIAKGEKFEDLAKQYSDDRTTGQLGGDLGFVAHAQILPELEDEISIASTGKVLEKVVVSRLGYHILYPVETAVENDKRLWHVKHILIQTQGFDQWYDAEAAKIKVINLLN